MEVESIVLFPRLNRLMRERAEERANDRLVVLAFESYAETRGDRAAFRALMQERINLDPLKGIIAEFLGALLEKAIDFLFDWLESKLGGVGNVLPLETPT